MPESKVESPSRGSWKWSRTRETQRVLLDAAQAAFIEHGYAQTSIADVVSRSDSSVGSLYHHFGDKNGLYSALWERWMNAQERAVKEAVAVAAAAGERGISLFLVGARRLLEGAWATRAQASVFYEKDGPPGFDDIRRRRYRVWLKQNIILLDEPDGPVGRLKVLALTAVMGEALREVVLLTDETDARLTINAALEMISRMDQGGPVASAGIPDRAAQ